MNSAVPWNADWAWSLPLIVVSVIFHALCFTLFHRRVARAMVRAKNERDFIGMVASVMGRTTLWATVLHATEAGLWASVYWLVGALPDRKSAMLYSLGAMTTYGHDPIYLAEHWHLMGTLEALNGVILFGMTTAFLYATIQKVWSIADHTAPA
jgi:hypothetical protein